MPRRPASALVGLVASGLLLCAPSCGRPEPEEPASARGALAPPPSPSPPPAPAPRLALWVPCEGSLRVLDAPGRGAQLVEDARALGATDLFVQVFRGGRAWFDASLADATPYQAIRTATGEDPLASLIARAQAAGLRVHAWVNALSLATRRDSALLRELGPGIVHVDRRGRSVLEYPDLEVPEPDRGWYRMGTPHVWLDPAAPGLAERLAAITGELVARYPGLDGVHLDYIRHPDVLPFSPGSRFGVGLDFGYGPASRERFRAETGRVAPFGDSLANANAWDDWRRERVTDVVRQVAVAVRAVRPGVAVSAAVWAYADRAYLAIFQDWRGWLDAGLLDFAVPMAYTLDDRLLRYLAHGYTGGVGGDRVWIGLGAWLFAERPERITAQLQLAGAAGPAGLALFSYDAIAESPALRAALVGEPARGE